MLVFLLAALICRPLDTGVLPLLVHIYIPQDPSYDNSGSYVSRNSGSYVSSSLLLALCRFPRSLLLRCCTKGMKLERAGHMNSGWG